MTKQPVHPHACGEYGGKRVLNDKTAGSSPRVWGIHDRSDAALQKRRFIPTRVGNTPRADWEWVQKTVHPHACGEYLGFLHPADVHAGSSPRVWGIPAGPGGEVLLPRFIPTRVGNTPRAAPACASCAVHPHACGEYRHAGRGHGDPGGSSPRVWGIQVVIGYDVVEDRFIPTRVGNTCRHDAGCGPGPVHPHACGEYWFAISSTRHTSGSSPRVWGILFGKQGDGVGGRFIPTRVGNTPNAEGHATIGPVHPHACGEYSQRADSEATFSGSSPRVWGILFRKMQEITDCWQSSSVLPSHACCKPAPMTIKRGRSFVKRLLPLAKNCPAGQSRSLDVTCPDRRNARLRS